MHDLRKSVFLSPYQGLATQGQVFRRLCHKGGPTLRRKAFRRLCHLALYPSSFILHTSDFTLPAASFILPTALMSVVAIIPAAGMGVRMGGGTPKQFLSLEGVPIFVHTLRKFVASEVIEEIYLVLRADDLERTRQDVERERF